MKIRRSFSLFTLLLIATIAGLAFALYQAKVELSKKSSQLTRYSEDLGFIDGSNETQFYFRRLGGYPPMSYAFRYQLPKGERYDLKVGAGPADLKNGRPPVVFERELSSESSQGTVVVSVRRRAGKDANHAWSVEYSDNDFSCSGDVEESGKFDWLELQNRIGPVNASFQNAGSHGSTRMLEGKKDFIVLHAEYELDNPRASASVDFEKRYQTFLIWLERRKSGDANR